MYVCTWPKLVLLCTYVIEFNLYRVCEGNASKASYLRYSKLMVINIWTLMNSKADSRLHAFCVYRN